MRAPTVVYIPLTPLPRGANSHIDTADAPPRGASSHIDTVDARR